MDKNHARKKASTVVNKFSSNIYFSSHSRGEMFKDGLILSDIWNVLKSSDSRILDEGELVNGSYRYRLETSYLVVVISFHENGEGFNVVTVWDKRGGRE